MSNEAFPVTERFQRQLSLSNHMQFSLLNAHSARLRRYIHPDYS
jgi:hypothetical protein